MSWGFGYQADGQMTSVAAESRSYNFNYDFNGLLLNRSNPWRTQQITQRDIRGRALIVNDYVGPTAALTESMRYRPDSKL